MFYVTFLRRDSEEKARCGPYSCVSSELLFIDALDVDGDRLYPSLATRSNVTEKWTLCDGTRWDYFTVE